MRAFPNEGGGPSKNGNCVLAGPNCVGLAAGVYHQQGDFRGQFSQVVAALKDTRPHF